MACGWNVTRIISWGKAGFHHDLVNTFDLFKKSLNITSLNITNIYNPTFYNPHRLYTPKSPRCLKRTRTKPVRPSPLLKIQIVTDILRSSGGGLLGGLGDTVGKTVGGVTNTLGDTVGGLGNTVGGATSGIGQTVSGATEGLGNTAKSTGQGVQGGVQSVGGQKQTGENPLGLNK